LVDHISTNLPASVGLATYFGVDEDNATNDIVLLMEYIDIMNVKKHVESFGSLQLDTVRHIIFQILSTLADLMNID
jgi:serine/threonine protein kinase